MGIKEYDFLTFTDKDLFEMRLAGTEPDFGYISCTKRAYFVEFCIKFGFMELQIPYIEIDRFRSKNCKLYEVHIPFRYMAMFRYEPKPVVMTDTSIAMVGEDSKMSHGGGRIIP